MSIPYPVGICAARIGKAAKGIVETEYPRFDAASDTRFNSAGIAPAVSSHLVTAKIIGMDVGKQMSSASLAIMCVASVIALLRVPGLANFGASSTINTMSERDRKAKRFAVEASDSNRDVHSPGKSGIRRSCRMPRTSRSARCRKAGERE